MKTALSALTFVALAGAAPAAEAPAGPCDTPEHRAFDFWIGDWTVTATGDPAKAAGVNHIALAHGGCVLVENWTGAGGLTGMSQNIFADGAWHQIWTDSSGGLLQMTGGIEGGAMRMQTTEPTSWGDDTPGLQRITWTPNPDGSVRQHGERSADGGKTWTTNFDLTYRRTP